MITINFTAKLTSGGTVTWDKRFHIGGRNTDEVVEAYLNTKEYTLFLKEDVKWKITNSKS